MVYAIKNEIMSNCLKLIPILMLQSCPQSSEFNRNIESGVTGLGGLLLALGFVLIVIGAVMNSNNDTKQTELLKSFGKKKGDHLTIEEQRQFQAVRSKNSSGCFIGAGIILSALGVAVLVLISR